MVPQYTALDLFCGAGGLSLGLSRAGFAIACVVDLHSAAVETHARNFEARIEQLDLANNPEFPYADVIAGGPPCQGFSSAGLRKADDERNSLVAVYANIVVRHRPRAFIFENVEGFLTAEGGDRVIELLSPLIEAGYRIHLRKVNAANYGVPQHRKRIIGLGGLGWSPTFPEPTHSAFGAPGAHRTANHLPPTPTVAQALLGLPAPGTCAPGTPQGHFYRRLEGIDARRAELLKPGQTMRDLPEELHHDSFRRRANRRVMDGTPTERRGGAPAGVRRLRADQPSKAITGGARAEFLHPTEDRGLTIRECARLQTFPDDFEFAGTIAQQTQLVGNAVPPRLAEIIARTLAADLAHAEDGQEDGALLSFLPTLAEGYSPVLRRVTERVKSEFALSLRGEELSLWP